MSVLILILTYFAYLTTTGRPHGITEDYVNVVGEIMYSKQTLGPYGYDAEGGRVSTNMKESFHMKAQCNLNSYIHSLYSFQ